MSLLRSHHIDLLSSGKGLFRGIFVLLFFSTLVKAQSPTDEEVKAVYIYNLINFVEWPSTSLKEPTNPFVIGVAGQKNYQTILKQLVNSETYRGHTIEVRLVEREEHVGACHILFMDEQAESRVSEFLASAKDKPILTISDVNDFMTSGGIVRFFIDNNKVKIEINQALAQERQLVISAKLLRLAKIYKP